MRKVAVDTGLELPFSLLCWKMHCFIVMQCVEKQTAVSGRALCLCSILTTLIVQSLFVWTQSRRLWLRHSVVAISDRFVSVQAGCCYDICIRSQYPSIQPVQFDVRSDIRSRRHLFSTAPEYVGLERNHEPRLLDTVMHWNLPATAVYRPAALL